MPHVLAEVYNPLKLSCDFLDNQHARSMFFLCSFFPEDVNISLRHLTLYFMGLGLFEGIRNLEEVRNRVCSLAELLKSRFLLLDSYDEHYVKMHDVVRDVAIFVASREGFVGPNFSSIDWSRQHSFSDCTWISMFSEERIELPMVLDVPSLRLLMIRNSKEREIQMHDQFFEVMKGLNVLSFRSLSFSLLPETIQLLKNLRTLYLKSCTLKSISIIGELPSLEILRCRSCHSIAELPAEIGRLTHLRLLEFSDCKRLKRVAPGVISSLVQLEKLKMIGSFKRWEAEENGKGRRNVSLNELQYLSNLECLKIEIEDCNLAAEEIRLSSKIVKYDIRFILSDSVKLSEKRMHLKCPREIRLGDWIHILLRSTEHLELIGDGSNNADLAQIQNIKRFNFFNCSTVKKLVGTTSFDWRFGVFPILEYLLLSNLPNLEEICDGPIQAGSNSFKNLKELILLDLPALMYLFSNRIQNVPLSNLSSISIGNCKKLLNLFPLTMSKGGLLQLKRLYVGCCEMMEEVFSNVNEKDGKGHITFPKLEKLSLESLPRLTTLCKGVESIEFLLLAEMDIADCPELKSFVSSTGNNLSLADHDNDSFHLFGNQKVTFGCLKNLNITGYENISNLWYHQTPPADFLNELEELKIKECANIRCLFSSSVAANLLNLKQLVIHSCDEMVKVIGDEENVYENSPIFPSLEDISLKSLDNLVNFCGWRCVLELPSLIYVSIDECPRMESFTVGSLTTPNLEYVDFEGKEDVEDLNGAVQLCFREKHQRDQELTQRDNEQGKESETRKAE
ncbi:hypothetical protein BUALT_BualtUnG0034500 [Buddleja alternifolia]|uniref:Disease resistance protein At4g27190-like leucine-rich repeats domain-containing protein n=1 Tax=Buddleja alternifolia TaxID=168488 RepID=A0AAV6W017_9LAMI|nr:hypothetical protein BUALT_BualtUnG0034500 [Buddleja alternifolia]